MARAYSLDLRRRAVAAVAAGQSCRQVALRFGISVASVVKWSQRFRRTGSAAARPMGGNRPYTLAGERDWLLRRLAEKPDESRRERDQEQRKEDSDRQIGEFPQQRAEEDHAILGMKLRVAKFMGETGAI